MDVFRPRLRVRRWLCSEALALLLLLALAGGLRFYHLLALDPFIDEVTWINEAVEHVYDETNYEGNVFVFPRIVLTSTFGSLPRPLSTMASVVDEWETHSTLWLPTAFHARPPLFFWLTLITTKLPENPLIGGRLASLLPDVASGCLLFLLTKQAYARGVAIVATVLWAVSPFALLLARIASDDPLLTLFSIATAYVSLNVMRTSSRRWPVMLGLALAGSMYTKTLGILNGVVPLLALFILVPRSDWLRKASGLATGYLIAAIALLPLIPWLPRLYGRASDFADVGTGGTDFDLLSSNFARAEHWAMDYFQAPFLVAIAVGCGVALVRRDRVSLYVLMAMLVPSIILLDRATILFSRYFSYAIFPAYVFAAYGLVGLGGYVGRYAGRVVGAGLTLGGLVLVIGAWLPLSVGLLVSPVDAPLTIEDHDQYVEAWYALVGVGTVADLIRTSAASASGGATVLEPVRGWWNKPRLPEDALGYYLWDQSRVRFVESQALLDADNLCELRSWTAASEPVFLVIDGAGGPAGGVPPDIPEYTRRLEAALARDLPEAREVLRIPRPKAANWLSVVQINARPSGAPASACRA